MSQLEGLEKARQPFDPATVGQLPRVTCKDCSNPRTECQRHAKQRCNICGAWVSTQHIHISYVGHAEITDRLLTVDPTWTWEPFALTPEGLPLVSKGATGESELWIRLTACGVTRPGVGSVEPGKPDTSKQLIGDAIRNAAMRFGMGLELWAKTELESSIDAALAGPPCDADTGEVHPLPGQSPALSAAAQAEGGNPPPALTTGAAQSGATTPSAVPPSDVPENRRPFTEADETLVPVGWQRKIKAMAKGAGMSDEALLATVEAATSMRAHNLAGVAKTDAANVEEAVKAELSAPAAAS